MNRSCRPERDVCETAPQNARSALRFIQLERNRYGGSWDVGSGLWRLSDRERGRCEKGREEEKKEDRRGGNKGKEMATTSSRRHRHLDKRRVSLSLYLYIYIKLAREVLPSSRAICPGREGGGERRPRRQGGRRREGEVRRGISHPIE